MDETTAEPSEGQVPAGDFELVPDVVVEEVSDEDNSGPHKPQKSVEEVAREVIAGHWGRGQKRNRRLVAWGYNVSEVDAEIKKIFNR